MPIGGDAYSASMRWQPTHQWSVFHFIYVGHAQVGLSVNFPLWTLPKHSITYRSRKEIRGKRDEEKEQRSNKAHMTINIHHHQGLENPWATRKKRQHRQHRYIRGCGPNMLESTGYETIKMRDSWGYEKQKGYRESRSKVNAGRQRNSILID